MNRILSLETVLFIGSYFTAFQIAVYCTLLDATGTNAYRQPSLLGSYPTKMALFPCVPQVILAFYLSYKDFALLQPSLHASYPTKMSLFSA